VKLVACLLQVRQFISVTVLSSTETMSKIVGDTPRAETKTRDRRDTARDVIAAAVGSAGKEVVHTPQELGEMLVAAATEGDAELCGKLLLKGADVNYQTDVRALFHLALVVFSLGFFGVIRSCNLSWVLRLPDVRKGTRL